MSTTNPFVHVDNVAKRWNGQLGVENISLSIPRANSGSSGGTILTAGH